MELWWLRCTGANAAEVGKGGLVGTRLEEEGVMASSLFLLKYGAELRCKHSLNAKLEEAPTL